MALAPFFDKAALAAATVLAGFDRDAFAATLDAHVVGVAFDEAGATAREGRTTLELAVNLLARLYPQLAMAGQGALAAAYSEQLVEIARAVNPQVEIARAEDATAWLVVGKPVVASDRPMIYVGSEGWITRVSSRVPQGSADTTNPFGASAAACFGAANVFRMIFGTALEAGALDDEFAMSLLNLDPTAADLMNPPLEAVNLGPAHLVGAGAIGNAVLWTLSRVPDLSGVLHVVDGEAVDATNPQRYVLTTPADEGVLKVDLAAREAARCGGTVNIQRHPDRWGHYLASLEVPWSLARVAVALDSAEDRIAVQAALPRRVFNAWTQAGDLGVSRHDFLGEQACLACLYLRDGPVKNDDQLVAEAIGLPEQLQAVRQLLYTGAPVGREGIERIAAALGISPEPLMLYADRGLREFYSEAICGGVVLRLQGNGDRRGRTEVPMAFQSALAGVLLAAALVSDAAGLPGPRGTKAVIDLLRPLKEYLTVPVAKPASGRCICQDRDYQEAYRACHGDASSSA
jgi:molybdopterin/thiamine biosynthesis adenylyltransferase